MECMDELNGMEWNRMAEWMECDGMTGMEWNGMENE